MESRIISSIRTLTISRGFYPRVEIFFFSESKIFLSSREYPTYRAVICRQNDQKIWQFADLLVT